jgi:hypothetical protein
VPEEVRSELAREGGVNVERSLGSSIGVRVTVGRIETA